MIQPLKRQQTEWALCWLDLQEPLPIEDDFFLPTFLLLVNNGFDPVVPPEIVEEPDQILAEEWLGRIFEEHGTPDRLLVWSAVEWSEDEWRSFGRDWKVKVRVVKAPAFGEKLYQHLHAAAGPEIFAVPPEVTRRDIAMGLVRSARRLKSQRKRRAALERALEIEPSCAVARVELADMDFQQGRYEASLERAEEVMHLEARLFHQPGVRWWADRETRPLLRSLYGAMMARWQLGQFPEAAALGERLLEILPDDNLGARFYVPLFHMQAGDNEEAAAYFRWYEEHYPADQPQPALLFGWACSLSLDGDDQHARRKYRAAFLSNIYIAPRILGLRGPREDIYHPTERDEPQFAHDFVGSFGGLWDRDASAMRVLREAYDELKPLVEELVERRFRLAEFLDQRYDPGFKEEWIRLVEEDEAFVKDATGG